MEDAFIRLCEHLSDHLWLQGLLVAAGCFVWEFWYTRDRDPQRCFKAFLHNHWAGLAIFVGIVLNYALA